LFDTGVLLAALDTRDPDHALCAALVTATVPREPILVPSTVIVELAYWVETRLSPEAWAVFLEDLSSGAYQLEHVTLVDMRRANEIDRQYGALGLGLVDSSLVALAERLDDDRIATLNERDFRPVVPAHRPYLRLLPADL
jgi:predicted nucleic acid-binding protein